MNNIRKFFLLCCIIPAVCGIANPKTCAEPLPHASLPKPTEIGACFPGTLGASPCPSGDVEITDGPSVSNCPDEYPVFDGCSVRPHRGNRIVLCCTTVANAK